MDGRQSVLYFAYEFTRQLFDFDVSNLLTKNLHSPLRPFNTPLKNKIKIIIILEEERIWIHLREEIESGRNEI